MAERESPIVLAGGTAAFSLACRDTLLTVLWGGPRAASDVSRGQDDVERGRSTLQQQGSGGAEDANCGVSSLSQRKAGDQHSPVVPEEKALTGAAVASANTARASLCVGKKKRVSVAFPWARHAAAHSN